MPDKQKYLVRAVPDRKPWGGIWALGAFITLKWHLLELDEKGLHRAEQSPHLQVREYDEEEEVDFLTAEETKFAAPKFENAPTLLQSVLSTDDDDEDDDEEEEEEVIEEEDERTNENVEEILKKHEAVLNVDHGEVEDEEESDEDSMDEIFNE